VTSLWEAAARRYEDTARDWTTDPVGWVDYRLKEYLWSRQRQIAEAVRDNRRTAVHSGHNVGKSFVASRLAAWWLDSHEPGEAFVVTCYTDDTEVLTKDGWKFFRDVRVGPEGDLFATRNQVTKEFEWQPAYRYHEAPWDGEVVDVRAASLHLRVTPNHRMLVKWRDYAKGTSGEILKPAEKITRRGAELPALSRWKGEAPRSVKFGRYEWDSVTFASFLGAWLAEGSLGPARKHVSKSGRKSRVGSNPPSGPIALTQLPGTKGYEPYRDLLTRMLGREPNHDQGKTFVFSCSDLWHYLRVLGKAGDKHIPAEVKDWGREELEALLHFYLLGDGWQDKKSGAWRACTVSSRLADDLQEVAQKVGAYATIRRRAPRDCRIEGRDIPASSQRDAYYLALNRAECRSVHVERSRYTGMVRCVSVPNEVLYVRRNGSPVWCGNTAPTGSQVRAILWRYIGRAHRKGRLPGRVNQTEWWIGDEIVAFGRKPADYSPEAFQGIHARYVLVILDEAGGIPADLWEAADSLTSNEGCKILAIGNPDDPSSHFATVCQPDSGWQVIGLSVLDSPNLTGEEVPDELRHDLAAASWVEEKRTEWGENSPLYQSKVLGQFPDNAEDTVVRLSKALECQRTPMEPGGPVELGVDVGGGGDETVIRERRGPVAGRVWKDHGTDTMLVVGKVMAAITETGATAVKVDSIGIGQGVADRLEELRREGRHQARVEAVNVGRSSTRPQMFPKLRDQLWWEIGRELTESGGWDLSAVDDATIAQLTAPKYGIDSSGRVKVEDKDDTRKRIGRSPDDADALLLAFYTRGGPAVVHKSARRVGKTPTVRGRGLG